MKNKKFVFLVLFLSLSLFIVTACSAGMKTFSFKNHSYKVMIKIPINLDYELVQENYENMYVYNHLKGEKINIYFIEMRIPDGWQNWKNNVLSGKYSSLKNPVETKIGDYDALRLDYFNNQGEFTGYSYRINLSFIDEKESLQMVIIPSKSYQNSIDILMNEEDIKNLINSIVIK